MWPSQRWGAKSRWKLIMINMLEAGTNKAYAKHIKITVQSHPNLTILH